MLRVGVPACEVENAAGRYRYRDGLLHSENNEPAIVCRMDFNTNRHIRGAYLSSVHYTELWQPMRSVRVSAASPSAVARPRTENRWYDRGDIHREYGPAVVGEHYWYKYHRGVQAAPPANSYTGIAAACCRRLLDFCTSDQCSGCVSLVAFSLLTDCRETVWLKVPIFVYRTCAGVVLECSGGLASRAYYRVVDADDWGRARNKWVFPLEPLN